MQEPVFTTEYLLDEATALAAKCGEQLTVHHFWRIADRDLGCDVVGGKAVPLTDAEIIKRAKNYIILDRAIVKNATDPTNPDIAASIKRTRIFEAHKAIGH